jgi:magnesium-transporting ATPase (P-type)
MRPARLVLCTSNGLILGNLTPEGPALSCYAKWSPDSLKTFTDDKAQRLQDTIRAVVLCSTASLESTGSCPHTLEASGSPTEIALLELAHKALFDLDILGLDATRKPWQSRGTFDFDSTSKTMSTGWYNAEDGTSLCAVKGAPESILKRCRKSDGTGTLADDVELHATLKSLAMQGLRVLAVAQRLDLPLADSAATITE